MVGEHRQIVLIAVLGFLLFACGGDEAVDPTTSLNVVASDFEFTPATYEVAANTELALTLTNDGTVEHEWVILSSPIDDEGQFDEDLVVWEEEVGAGESTTSTIPPLDPGTYQIVCAVQGHFAAGMEGELVAVDG